MATGIRKCKICGKEYQYCKTNRKANIFRYQDVACCPEHGSQYFAKIEASRAPKKDESSLKKTKKRVCNKGAESYHDDENLIRINKE